MAQLHHAFVGDLFEVVIARRMARDTADGVEDFFAWHGLFFSRFFPRYLRGDWAIKKWLIDSAILSRRSAVSDARTFGMVVPACADDGFAMNFRRNSGDTREPTSVKSGAARSSTGAESLRVWQARQRNSPMSKFPTWISVGGCLLDNAGITGAAVA